MIAILKRCVKMSVQSNGGVYPWHMLLAMLASAAALALTPAPLALLLRALITTRSTLALAWTAVPVLTLAP